MTNLEGLLALKGRSPTIAHCLFDLVGTIAWSAELEETLRGAAVKCVASRLGTNEMGAEKELRRREKQQQVQLGYRPSLTGLVASFDIGVREWASCQHQIEIEEYLTPDSEVIGCIDTLMQWYGVTVYTNMPARLTHRALQTLGLRHAFLEPCCSDQLGSIKPDRRTVRRIAAERRFVLESTLAIGDRYEIDLVPVIESGGIGYLVSGREGLLTLCDALIQRARTDPYV